MLPCSTDRESISSFIKSDSSDLFERGVGGGCHLCATSVALVSMHGILPS